MAGIFNGKVVAVTGAAGGLGRALALGFAREGAQLILTDIDAAGLKESEDILRGQGTSYLLDLAVESEIVTFGQTICSKHPKLDVLVNNAGLAYGEISSGFEKLNQEKWLRFFAVNSVAPLLLAQALRPSLAAARGVILNQSSMASYTPATAYGVTKLTLNAMTFGMANAFAADGIRVNAIAPGLMETPASQKSLPPGTHERIRSLQLLDLHGTPEDIVSLALFLASDAARFITGEVMSCDGGNRLKGWRN